MKFPRNLSGQDVVKILTKLGFEVTGRKGSHVRLSKILPDGKKVGTVVPMHTEVAVGTLKNALRLAEVSEEEFMRYLK